MKPKDEMGAFLLAAAVLIGALCLTIGWLLIAPRRYGGMVPPGCGPFQYVVERLREPRPSDHCPRPGR